MDRDEPSIQNTAPGQQIDNNAPVQGQNIGTYQQITQNYYGSEHPSVASSAPAPPAPIWTVPLLRNPHFTGRADLLAQLAERLAPPSHENGQPSPKRAALTQPHAITGLGGIGKTQLAVEYAYRSREQGRYTHTLWINAASEEIVISSFVALAGKALPKEMQSEPDQRKLVEAVKSWLEGCSQPWLLIYDNADDPLAVEPYLPRSGNGSILLTTRDQAVSAFAAPLSVDTMSLQEGIDLLLKRARCADTASQAEQAAARAIVQALDAFPLALDQAGAYIEESECRLVDYLQLYRRHPATLLGRRGRQASQYPDAVATTWAISFAKVEQASPAAADLLRLCAFLAPDQIPEEIISEGAAHWPPALQQAASDPLVFNEMIAELRKYSLVSRLPESHSLRLHRLVQAVQLDTMDLETQRQWAERVVLALYALFPHDPDDVKTWPRCQRLLAQAQACHEMIERYTLQRIEAAHLLHNAGMYLIDHALYEQAEPLYQHALSIKEQELGPEHLDTTATLGNLANLYLEQGQHEQAEALYQRVLAIKERQLGPEHPDTATTLNNVAELYTDQGQYEQAEPLYQRALAIYERMLGPEHPRTQRVRRKYAELLQAMGRETEAEKMEEG